jgi:hypothetical protein
VTGLLLIGAFDAIRYRYVTRTIIAR